VDHPEERRAQTGGRVPIGYRLVDPDEGPLDHVLGAVPGKQTTGAAHERSPMSRHQQPEGRLEASRRQLDEPFVHF